MRHVIIALYINKYKHSNGIKYITCTNSVNIKSVFKIKSEFRFNLIKKNNILVIFWVLVYSIFNGLDFSVIIELDPYSNNPNSR